MDTHSLTPEAARAWLEKTGGETGVHIGMLARQINGSLAKWGGQMLYRDDLVWILVPEGIPTNIAHQDFARELDRLTWIEHDLNNPMRLTRTLDSGRRGIPLKRAISTKILLAAYFSRYHGTTWSGIFTMLAPMLGLQESGRFPRSTRKNSSAGSPFAGLAGDASTSAGVCVVAGDGSAAPSTDLGAD